MSRSVLVPIDDPSAVGEARRQAATLSQGLAPDETQAGKVSLVITELAANLLKHAGGGQIVLRPLDSGPVNGIEILAVDKGPGMADTPQCMKDGYSTAATPGNGLGAVSRLSDVFDIYSQPGKGTVIVSQILAKTGGPDNPGPIVGAICLPIPGEQACGDDWAIRLHNLDELVLIADGLGHGVLAAQAADAAVATFLELPSRPAGQFVEALHGPLRSTRGASLAVAEVRHASETLVYAGVGNIAGIIFTDGQSRSLVTNNGIVGHQMPRVNEFNYPFGKSSTLVLHSDGLISRWKIDPYPGILARHPSILAGVLYRDAKRGRDDVSVIVMRRAE